MTRSNYHLAVFLAIAALSGVANVAHAQLCGGPLEENNFNRPIDYTSSQAEAANINLVERFHFNSKVSALISGLTAPLPMDIAYTLRQIPNHYGALNAMARYQLKNPRRADAEYLTAECYFERAFAFRPEDGTLHLLYGVYLHQKKDYRQALAAYERAQSLKLDSSELAYDMGLLYFDMGEYKQSREYALKAYEAGFPLQGLKKKLAAAGQWSTPAASAAPGADAAAAR